MNRTDKQQMVKLNRGVSLLENMIALLILTIGLLGIAGLQTFTLKSGTISAHRLNAVQQANAMADQIRANLAAVYMPADGDPKYDDVDPQASYATPPSPNCETQSCNPQQLAAYDIWVWGSRNNELLPGTPGAKGGYVRAIPLYDNIKGGDSVLWPSGTTTAAGPTRFRYIIAMYWDGDRTGTTSGPIGVSPTAIADFNCPPASVTDMDCFVLEFDL